MQIWSYIKIIFILAAFESGAAHASNNSAINDWQKAIVGIGRSITERDQSDSSWIVEYNSSFPSTEIGLVLAPASYDKNASSLNVVAICAPTSSSTVSTEGRDFADFASGRTFSFGLNASPPPGFLSGSLAAASASLAVDRSKQVAFSLSDTSIKQVLESDAIEAINRSDCVRRIKHRRDVFFVRGQYLMRLVMSQSRTGNGAVGVSLDLIGVSPPLGFGVRWNRSLDWQITQAKPRPWFRIVSRFRRNDQGTGYELVQ